MKNAVAFLLVVALFFGIGAYGTTAASESVKVTEVNDGILIENSDIPDISEIVKQNNLERNFFDFMIKVRQTRVNYYLKNAQKDILWENPRVINAMEVYTIFLSPGDVVDKENQGRILEWDTKIGISKIGKKTCVAYVITGIMDNESIYIYIEQEANKLFIRPGEEASKHSRDTIRRLMNTEDENISYYDFDIILAINYGMSQDWS